MKTDPRSLKELLGSVKENDCESCGLRNVFSSNFMTVRRASLGCSVRFALHFLFVGKGHFVFLGREKKDHISKVQSLGSRLGEDSRVAPTPSTDPVRWTADNIISSYFLILSTLSTTYLILYAVLTLRDDHRLIYLLPASFVMVFISGLLRWKWVSRSFEYSADGARLLDEKYIGSWRFDVLRWKDFAKYLQQQKVQWLDILLSIMGTSSIVLFLRYVSHTEVIHTVFMGLICSVISFVCFFVIINSIFDPLYRSYSPTVHCCVLGRGAIYALGTMYSLQPSTSFFVASHTLTAAVLEEKMIGSAMTAILRLELRTRESAITLEVPVPDQMVPDVTRWMVTLMEGYTEDVVATTAVEKSKAGVEDRRPW
ncbi:hypothetical protein PROFUN_06608 [Planoprotostelium fungivorum]|uniref:Uncharacterized protein n=1 Tax=Planoprotostelium fungivorum TaxID=1890364 RepID=A0A2P6MRZ2_9EUKA|nr:hypothetical protein PROFUN_06608 [Planoprotostelium fungivorum]